MQKLTHLSDHEVILYFRFENMVKREPDFCPLYREEKKCHETEILNCYLCACPWFHFADRGLYAEGNLTCYSTCRIDAQKGKQFKTERAVHQDCSDCLLPHKESFIRRVFRRNWFEMMQQCSLDGF